MTEPLRRPAALARCLAAALCASGLAAPALHASAAETPFPRTPAQVRLDARLKVDSLRTVVLADPPGLARYVKDRTALRQLGKALFWDQQVGSDGNACASCHFHAGADSRSRNQLNPGFRSTLVAGGDRAFGDSPLQPLLPTDFGPDRQLTAADFPLHQLADFTDRRSAVLRDTNDVVSSQGVFNAAFLQAGLPADQGAPSLSGFGAVFHVGGALVRSAEPRNTPTSVNAVFNHRSFWDGRARSEFNGASPFGALDWGARLVSLLTVGSTKRPRLAGLRIELSSAASQAVGPPLSDLEMSFGGRRFADLGRKLLDGLLVPLGQQAVALDDSLLGPLAAGNLSPGAAGLSARYLDLVRTAFQPEWWDGDAYRVEAGGAAPAIVTSGLSTPTRFTVAEWNFSLFFGLAVAEYERTLVADQTPFDRFMEFDDAALTPAQVRGLDVFAGRGRCANCHGGPELSNAGLSGVLASLGPAPRGEQPRAADPLERMIAGDGRIAAYDDGFYNIGVRPSAEDVGVGAGGPGGQPLANVRLAQGCVAQKVAAGMTTMLANTACKVARIPARPDEAALFLEQAAVLLGQPSAVRSLLDQAHASLLARGNLTAISALLVQARDLMAGSGGLPAAAQDLLGQATRLLPDPFFPGGDPLRPLGPFLEPGERVAVTGAFKVPGLRNVALTAPYFHNGGQATLMQVVQFYDRGGDFAEANLADLAPDILPLGLTAQERQDLVAFLEALTDERVGWDRAPFDHPSLDLADGGGSGATTLALFPGFPVLDDRLQLPAVGAAGSAVPLGTPGTPFGAFLDPLR